MGDGRVELTVNLLGNESPDLAKQVTFLVSQLPIPQPVLGSNVFQEMINRRGSSGDSVTTVTDLLQKALGVEYDQVQAIISFI